MEVCGYPVLFYRTACMMYKSGGFSPRRRGGACTALILITNHLNDDTPNNLWQPQSTFTNTPLPVKMTLKFVRAVLVMVGFLLCVGGGQAIREYPNEEIAALHGPLSEGSDPPVYCRPRLGQFCPGGIPCPDCGQTRCKCPSGTALNVTCKPPAGSACNHGCRACCKTYITTQAACITCANQECGSNWICNTTMTQQCGGLSSQACERCAGQHAALMNLANCSDKQLDSFCSGSPSPPPPPLPPGPPPGPAPVAVPCGDSNFGKVINCSLGLSCCDNGGLAMDPVCYDPRNASCCTASHSVTTCSPENMTSNKKTSCCGDGGLASSRAYCCAPGTSCCNHGSSLLQSHSTCCPTNTSQCCVVGSRGWCCDKTQICGDVANSCKSKYLCSGGICKEDANGTYTSDTCDDTQCSGITTKDGLLKFKVR
eukprot:SAG31_NODE_3480_length_4223_cov_23.570078_4_plen_426_part_00